MTTEAIEAQLESPDWRIRRATVENENIPLTYAHFCKGLEDEHESVRYAFVTRLNEEISSGKIKASDISKEQIEKGLTDSNAGVRAEFASMDVQFTPGQISRGVRDNDKVARIFIFRTDVHLTQEDIEFGLQRPETWLRIGFSKHRDCIPTPEQLERGLTDEKWMVRGNFIELHGSKMSDHQIERSLNDRESLVREIAAKQPHFYPSIEQEYRGLNDVDNSVKKVFETRREEWERLRLKETFQSKDMQRRRKTL
jgi:hypothetical protein